MAHSEETKRKISENRKGKGLGKRPPEWCRNISLSLTGKKLSDSHKKSLSDSHKGNPGYWLGKKRSEADREKFRVSHLGKSPSIEQRRKLSESVTRAKASMRSPDSKDHDDIRKSLDYRLWRESVFKRDSWTCVLCSKKGVKIHADHIKPFAYFPELRFELTNGRTLCVPCHMKTDTWGRGPKRKNEDGTYKL